MHRSRGSGSTLLKPCQYRAEQSAGVAGSLTSEPLDSLTALETKLDSMAVGQLRISGLVVNRAQQLVLEAVEVVMAPALVALASRQRDNHPQSNSSQEGSSMLLVMLMNRRKGKKIKQLRALSYRLKPRLTAGT